MKKRIDLARRSSAMTEAGGRAFGLDAPLDRRSLLQLGGALTITIGLAGPLASCAAPVSSGTSTGSKTIRIAFKRALPTLDNKSHQIPSQVTVQRAVHQGLTGLGKDLKLQNVLAESFEQTSPTEWTVKLRKGAVYSDGSPVTVEDVSTALSLYPQVAGSYVAGLFPEFPTVRKVDDQSFVLVTTKPLATLDFLMTSVLLMPAAKNAAKDVDTAPGTGAFVISKQNAGAGTATLTPNPKYAGTKPGLGSVELQFIQDSTVAVAALKRGEVDVVVDVAPNAAKELETVDGVTVIRNPGAQLIQLFYNFRMPKSSPLSDPKVREALSYAIDGDTLIKQILLDSVVALDGVAAPSLIGTSKVGSFSYDPAKATSMLASAGASGLELTMIWETGEFFDSSQIMEAVSEMLKKVGVKVKLKEFQAGGDIGTWRQGRGGHWDVIANGYGNQTGLALVSLTGMYGGTPAKEAKRATYHGYVFPEIADQLSKAAAEPDESARNAILTKAQQDIWATRPAMWGFVQNNALAVRDHLKGIELLSTNFYDLAAVTST